MLVEGDAEVSLWRENGTPLDRDDEAEPSTSAVQYFATSTTDPVTLRLELNASGAFTIDIIEWRYKSGGIMGSKLEEVDQHAIFEFEEPSGARAELTVARGDDFKDLRLLVDRDAHGTPDSEYQPIVTSTE